MPIKTILTCDGCGATLELEGPYHIAKTEMKEKKWRNLKVGEKWVIKCRECRSDK